MASDPDLLTAAGRQLDTVREAGDALGAFLGWWAAWSVQSGVDRDDLVDLLKERGLLVETPGEVPG